MKTYILGNMKKLNVTFIQKGEGGSNPKFTCYNYFKKIYISTLDFFNF